VLLQRGSDAPTNLQRVAPGTHKIWIQRTTRPSPDQCESSASPRGKGLLPRPIVRGLTPGLRNWHGWVGFGRAGVRPASMASVPLSANVVVPLLRWLDPKQLDVRLYRCRLPQQRRSPAEPVPLVLACQRVREPRPAVSDQDKQRVPTMRDSAGVHRSRRAATRPITTGCGTPARRRPPQEE